MLTDITWRPHVGDPTWIGWITVVAYLIAILFCLRAGWQARQKSRTLENESSMIWFAFAAGLFLLGVNKQLDLQTAFIELGGQFARDEDWYQQRRQFQIFFVVILGLTMAGLAFVGIFKQRHFFKKHLLTLLGSIFLAVFVFLRAATFNHVDNDVGLNLDEEQWMDGMELIGIVCFIAASFRAIKIFSRKK